VLFCLVLLSQPEDRRRDTVAASSRIYDLLRRRGWYSTAAEAEIAPEIATDVEIAPAA
jgi:hypothetical protein